MIIIDNVKDFDLDHIFDCGQCFRWDKQEGGSYTGAVRGMPPVNISISPSKTLMIDSADGAEQERFWRGYLDLGRDYGAVKKVLSENDHKMSEIITFGSGIRILRQDEWETLISFIISQNNNIARIKKCINTLCKNFGKQAGEYNRKEYFSFPEPETLARLAVEDLSVCSPGYRARYIIETAKAVAADNCEKLYAMKGVQAEEAFDYLTGLCGVGPKVANCIMLFSMGKIGSFPIDVRIRQAMNQVFGIPEQNIKAMAEYAAINFGEYGGIAQQYLYYYVRNHKSKGE